MFEEFIGEDLGIGCGRMLLMSCVMQNDSKSKKHVKYEPPHYPYFLYQKPFETCWKHSVRVLFGQNALIIYSPCWTTGESLPKCLPLLFYLVFKLTKWLQTPLNSAGVSSFQVRATCVRPTSRTARSTTPRTSTPTGVWTSGLAPAAPWPPWQPPGARWRRAKTSSNPSWWLLSGAGWSRGKLWGFCWTRRLLTPLSRSWMTSPKPLS